MRQPKTLLVIANRVRILTYASHRGTLSTITIPYVIRSALVPATVTAVSAARVRALSHRHRRARRVLQMIIISSGTSPMVSLLVSLPPETFYNAQFSSEKGLATCTWRSRRTHLPSSVFKHLRRQAKPLLFIVPNLTGRTGTDFCLGKFIPIDPRLEHTTSGSHAAAGDHNNVASHPGSIISTDYNQAASLFQQYSFVECEQQEHAMTTQDHGDEDENMDDTYAVDDAPTSTKQAIVWHPPHPETIQQGTTAGEVAIAFTRNCGKPITTFDGYAKDIQILARNLAIRWPKARPFKTVPKWDRNGYVRSLLIQIYGEERVIKCRSCNENMGRWELCVTDKRESNGACASCSYSTKNAKCQYQRTLRT